MTEKNIEKLAEEGEKLLMNELESRYLKLTRAAYKFMNAKKTGTENTQPGINEKYCETRVEYLLKNLTPKQKFNLAFEDYKRYAEHVKSFGLSISPFTIDLNSYEEALK